MKTVAIIQARTGSTRLPGKVLMPLGDRPMILHVLARAARSRADAVVLATSSHASDDALARLVRAEGYAVHRGALDDVLDRYLGAARQAGAQRVVRLTGDCPLADPGVVDLCLERHDAGDCDYVSNAYPTPSFPDGLDVEVFSAEVLERAWREARKPSEREHVTPYVWNNPGLFRLGCVRCGEDLSALRWTVDEARDMEFMRRVFAALPNPDAARMADVLALLRREPSLAGLNEGIERNEGYRKSLRQDAGEGGR